MDSTALQTPEILALSVLAALGGFLAYDFVRGQARTSAPALIVAVLFHGAAMTVLGSLDRLPHAETNSELDPIEVIEIPPPKVEPLPEPEPEPETEPEPTPPPKVEPPKAEPPKPRIKTPPVKVQAAPPEAVPSAPSAAPLRFDLSNTVVSGQSGVTVQVGEQGGVAGGRHEKGQAKSAAPKAVAEGPAQSGKAAWAPVSEVFVGKGPTVLKVPEIECPATAEQGVEGVVSLRVLVRRDGSVYQVKINKGIGSGCDELARQALQKARFKPATDTHGAPIDYEISAYHYIFKVSG